MSLSSALKQGPSPDPRIGCGVCDWLATQPTDEAAEFNALLIGARRRENEWTVESLWKVAQGEGLRVQSNRLRVHTRDCL